MYGSGGNRRTPISGGESLALSNIQGIGGSIPPMLSHGLVPSALFLCVGVLYDRHKTRLVRYYGGSVSTMPNLSTISFSSTLANMSGPGTSSSIRESHISRIFPNQWLRGIVPNPNHSARKFSLGRRPIVRGVAMNPVDYPL